MLINVPSRPQAHPPLEDYPELWQPLEPVPRSFPNPIASPVPSHLARHCRHSLSALKPRTRTHLRLPILMKSGALCDLPRKQELTLGTNVSLLQGQLSESILIMIKALGLLGALAFSTYPALCPPSPHTRRERVALRPTLIEG
jgi:hypothetical protein